MFTFQNVPGNMHIMKC